MPSVLSDADVALLRRMAEQFRRRPYPGNRAAVDLDEIQTPELYLARTPPDGISGLGGATGTGPESGDEPGYADCEIATLVETTAGVKKIKLAGFTHRVYNRSSLPFRGSTWAIICRDKFGEWWVCGEFVPGVPTGYTTGTGTGTDTASACYQSIGGLELDQIPGYRSGVVQLLGHDATGCLEWFDVEAC